MPRNRWVWWLAVVVWAGALCGCSDPGGQASQVFGVGADGEVWAFGLVGAGYSHSVRVTWADSNEESWSVNEVAPGMPPESRFQSAFVDQQGRPWFITRHRGPTGGSADFEMISMFDGQWRAYSSDEIGCPGLDDVLPGPEGTVWVSGGGCVAYMDSLGSWNLVASPSVFPGDGAGLQGIGFAYDGTLWVAGMWPDGWVGSWDGTAWDFFDGDPFGDPGDMAFDGEGGVWVSYFSELAHFDGAEWHTWSNDAADAGSGWREKRMGQLLVDDDGGVWVLYSGGSAWQTLVSYFKDGRWTNWTEQDGLPVGTTVSKSWGRGRVRNDITHSSLLRGPNQSVLIRLGEICTDRGPWRDPECVEGGWAIYDGTWSRSEPLTFGFQSPDGDIWHTHRGEIQLADRDVTLAPEPIMFAPYAVAPTTTASPATMTINE